MTKKKIIKECYGKTEQQKRKKKNKGRGENTKKDFKASYLSTLQKNFRTSWGSGKRNLLTKENKQTSKQANNLERKKKKNHFS